MSDMEERSMAAKAFQAGIDSFKDSDARLEAENVSLRKDWKEMKRLLEWEQERLKNALATNAETLGKEVQRCVVALNERDAMKEDIRFLLKCIVTDPTEGMGQKRDDPVRVNFRKRLDGIREKVK